MASRPGVISSIRRTLFGAPRPLDDDRLFHRLSLVPFLAWVGLGADGLSSSSYGPEAAYLALGRQTWLALGLVILMAITVFLIAAAYSRIIEQFPHGGGGYVVATKLLGSRAGVVSGTALLVDYVLTITTSLAAAGDAIFNFVPAHYHPLKLTIEIGFVLALTVLNIRGVRESVLALVPVFLVFLVTHAIVLVYGIAAHLPEAAATAAAVRTGAGEGVKSVGVVGLMLLFVRAYSLGGGTYTGIEAVSNGIPIMREPRVQTARRTMTYMAVSLAVTASGLLLCYLLWQIGPVAGKTMNGVLVERMAGHWPLGSVFVVVTLLSEGLLLVVAAQAGFLDGPRVLANMAVDSWVPHRFAALSERLTTQNGIVLMGAASLAALLYTRGDVGHLLVMYSINVFLTFSLSMLGMLIHWIGERGKGGPWVRRTVLFGSSFLLCATILVITIAEKFREGGWITLAVTALCVFLFSLIRRHYRGAAAQVRRLYAELKDLPVAEGPVKAPDPTRPTAAILVSAYNGVGIHTVLNAIRAFPGHFGNVVFISVAVIDSGEFKGEGALAELRQRTQRSLDDYVRLAHGLGLGAASRMGVATEVVEEAERLCLAVAAEYPRTTFFAGQLIFQRERWYQRLLHNETPMAVQKRLQWLGKTMVTLPIRVREA